MLLITRFQTIAGQHAIRRQFGTDEHPATTQVRIMVFDR